MSRHRVTTQPCRATTQQAGRAGRALGAGELGRWREGAGHAARALGTRHGRWARGLGARAGQGCALGAPNQFLIQCTVSVTVLDPCS